MTQKDIAARVKHPVELTFKESSTDLLPSQYGNISYVEWCRLESERLLASGRRAFVLNSGRNRCCLVVEGGAT